MKTFRGQAVEGELFLDDPIAFQKHVKAMPGPVEVMVRAARPLRSFSQQGYYRSTVLPEMAEGSGHTEKEMHVILKERFLRDEKGKVGSTTKLDTRQFSDFLDRCVQLGAEYGIVVSSPRAAGHSEEE